MWSQIRQKNRHSQKCTTSQIRNLPQLNPTKVLLCTHTHTHTHKGSHFYFLVKTTTKHRKIKRTPFRSHSHHGESTMTIQRTPRPQKSHHHISTASHPPNIHSNFISMFNIQYTKYHIFILSNYYILSSITADILTNICNTTYRNFQSTNNCTYKPL